MIALFNTLFARIGAYRRHSGDALKRGIKFLFGRGQLRSTLVASVLCLIAPLSHATDVSDLSGLNNFICLVSGEVSGPWLYVIGIILIIVGAVAIASAESTIVKLLSTFGIGFGIATAALPIVKNHFSLTYACT